VQGHLSPREVDSPPAFIRTSLLRDPLERLISNFCFFHKTRYRTPEQLAFLKNCRRYREGWFSGDDIERWIGLFDQDNYQTRFLSGCRAPVLTQNAIKVARDALEGCELVGTTEQMSAYLVALAEIAGLEIRETVHANLSPRGIIDEDPASLRERLGPYVRQDAVLYDYARERFAELAKRLQIPLPAPLESLTEEAAMPTLLSRLAVFVRRSPSDQRQRIWRRMISLKLRAWDTLSA
jgi:hypothetical protein